MATVGRILASERIRQGLDLNSVAAVTKIPLRTLRAIEADEFEQLPGLLFARNFVRQYAESLRLDPEAAVAQFNREQSMAPPDISALARTPEIRVPGTRAPVWSRVLDGNVFSAFFTFILTLAVCGAAFYGFEYLRARNAAKAVERSAAAAPARQPAASNAAVSSSPAVSKPEEAAATPEPVVTPDASEPAPGAAPETPATPATSATVPAPVGTGTLHVAVEAAEPCWARVTVDGKTVFTGILTPGDAKQFDGEQNVNIRAGNAGALVIKLNGNDVPAIGPKGQIRVVTLTASGAQVRTPTPDPVLDF